MNILFYGTCQSKAIKSVLNLNKEYNQYHIQCYNTDITHENFDNIINKCDIIITQPIPDNYRDKIYLSTNYIIQNCKKNCKILIYQRQYLNFYYFDTSYKQFNGDTLHKPIDYHYNEMINCYKNNLSIEYYINNIVNNKNYKTKEELEQIVNTSIKYLREKDKEIVNNYVKSDNIKYIPVVDYIVDNYKNKLLFYSMNHPTKFTLQFICEKIIELLNIKNTINYNIDPLNDPRCIIYKCIENVVNFDVSNNNIITCNKNSLETITQLYYDTYTNIKY
jgi:hypothetical protein